MSRKDGYSRRGIFRGYESLRFKWTKTGHSSQGIFGGMNHYDEDPLQKQVQSHIKEYSRNKSLSNMKWS